MKTGPELIDEIIADPNSLDVLLDRDPHARPYTDEELDRLIAVERARRTQLEIKEEKRKMKKQGIEDDSE